MHKHKHPRILIIFDCDGTLVDSEYLCNLALEIKLAEVQIIIDAYSLMRDYRGWKLSSIIEKIENQFKKKLPTDFTSTYRYLVTQLFNEKLSAIPHVKTVLDKISAPMCVASSGPAEKIKHSLTTCNLIHYFNNNIFSSYDVGSWKPEPDLFLYAASFFNVPTNRCIVIEDSEPGIIAAKRAAMTSVFFNPHQLDINCKPNFEINSMLDLPNIIENFDPK